MPISWALEWLGLQTGGASGAAPGPRQEMREMMSVVMGLLGLAAGSALVVWGAGIRRDMDQGVVLRGAGLLPAGAAQEAS
jgi:hypothetical protein